MGFDQVADKVEAQRRLPTPLAARALREAVGLSQSDVASAVGDGVSRAAVSRWEGGTRRPSGNNLVAYVELLEALRREAGAA